MKPNRFQTVLIYAAVALSSATFAAPVFDNGNPDGVSGTEMTEFVVADDFTVSSISTVSNIRFWSAQSAAGDYSGSVSWAIFSDVANAPTDSLFSGFTNVAAFATGATTGFGYEIFQFDIPVTFTLSAGNFWLALHNGPLSSTNSTTMLWATTTPGSGYAGVYLDGSTWVESFNEHAFRIDSTAQDMTVPAPHILAILLIGFANLKRLRRNPRPGNALSQPLLNRRACMKISDHAIPSPPLRLRSFRSLLAIVPVLCAPLCAAQRIGPIVEMPAFIGVSDTLTNIVQQAQPTPFIQNALQIESDDNDVAKGAPSVEARGSTKALIPTNARAALAAQITVPAPLSYLQTATFQNLNITPGLSFEGLGLGTPGYNISSAPSGATVAVSPTQVVQWVNSQIAVYNKSGAPLLSAPGFVNGNSIWLGLGAGSLCAAFNRGDPMVQYDRMSQRWVLTQFAFNSAFSSNSQCIAVSQTNDATGSYHLYEYSFGNLVPDSPKLGVWTDGYYLTYNMFANGINFSGGRSCAYDKAAMLVGAAATQVCFTSNTRFAFLPGDFDGTILPPAEAPNPQISWNWAFSAGPPAAPYKMQLTKFKPNFVTPALSTFDDGFGGVSLSSVEFQLDSGTIAACSDIGGACVPQSGTGNRLETLADRHNFRLVYRNFGTHEALLFTQAVDPSTAPVAAVRWWEIRDPNSVAPVIFQSSTYAPGTESRWMSSAAFDKRGNIAIGYTASSSTINPSIRLTGRLRIDPKNLMRSEIVVQAGTGSQTGTLTRWGDNTTMQIDPADDCTFWYTAQYLATNGSFNWRTRIASFKYPNCQ